jgi:two-component system alkaline phosphatase synthesis response regulator PhoP
MVVMPRIMMVAQNQDRIKSFSELLANAKLNFVVSEKASKLLDNSELKFIDLLLVDFSNVQNGDYDLALFKEIKESKRLSILAIVSADSIRQIETVSGIDDFVAEPVNPSELMVRINRALKRVNRFASKEVINCGVLVIDTAKCEVYLDERLLSLTFKEYELLKFLASNKGRVFSRDDLLNEVWGYEYYGGDRTVDVHVTRLRNKIESAGYSFIETVRNIGYKFKEENKICMSPL